MLSTWFPWILAAAVLIVLPVVLRFAVDEEPRNEIAQDPGPDVLTAAA